MLPLNEARRTVITRNCKKCTASTKHRALRSLPSLVISFYIKNLVRLFVSRSPRPPPTLLSVGTDEEILKFARDKYNATFQLFSKVNVNGKESHEVYRYLKANTGRPIFDTCYSKLGTTESIVA